MKFHGFLEELLGSKAKISILRTLTRFPAKSFTGRELARLVNISASRTLEILRLFKEYGLVNQSRLGKTLQWNLNSQALLVKEISPILSMEIRVFEHLKTTLKKALNSDEGVLAVALFGSIVRGEERPNSDVDVFILVKEEKDKPRIAQRVRDLNLKTLSIYGNVISEIIYSQKEYHQKRKNKFVQQIEREGDFVFRSGR